MDEIVLYTSKTGHVELNVNLSGETVWLSMKQMVELFGRDKSVISRHLNNIFKTNELDKKSVVAKYATTAKDGKTYQVDYYNLDAIISVGYRVNSKEGTRFRKWASQILRDHLIKGYTINHTRLSEKGMYELQQTMQLLEKTLKHHNLVNDIGKATLQLIISYAKTWQLLLAYDEGNLSFSSKTKTTDTKLSYQEALSAIGSLKDNLISRGEATNLFGQERDMSLDSILKNLEQTFDGTSLYPSSEEKAAHLLYFIIKDHPFTDGNKRIGSFLFLIYLVSQDIPLKLNENGLIALALLVAESEPNQKDIIIRLIINLLID
ncbi:virulence RhuM family protein [Thiotrichales bacterium 19S3-7]|nr:virulence RhuM family protein [Thiotrichales bacterium 19S3-7]MCF6802576.1 virulence RhuM family protein [Thiotrichales bacterium 19S3-11]